MRGEDTKAKPPQDSLTLPQPDAGGGGGELGLSASHIKALSHPLGHSVAPSGTPFYWKEEVGPQASVSQPLSSMEEKGRVWSKAGLGPLE